MQVAHVDEGAGEAVLFVHGIISTLEYWRRQVPHVAGAAGRRAIALDLPGFGKSDKPDAPYTVAWFAEVLRRLLDAKGIARAAVVGNSLGGLIALRLALDHPRMVSRLVLVAPAGINGYPYGALDVALRAFGGAAASRLPRVPGALFAPLFSAVFPTRPDLAARFARAYAQGVHDPEYPARARAFLRTAQGVVRAPRALRGRLGAIAVPTLIVWGRRDLLLFPGAARALARRIPGARLLLYDRSGHCPMIDEPDRFNADLSSFLDSSAHD